MKFLFLLLLPLSAFANSTFEKITVTKLDMQYTAPYGEGTAEKVGIGLGPRNKLLADPKPFPLQVTKTGDSFELTSPYVDFTWRDPVPFIFDLEKVEAVETSAALGTKSHFVESKYFMAQPKGRGEFKAWNIKGTCDGTSLGRFEARLLHDCRNNMNVTIKKIDVPTDILLYQMARNFPAVEVKEDIPADNVVLKIDKGDYYLQVYVKYWIYAGLRLWGHVQFENNQEVIAVRVDQVKFGYLPITTLFMKLLKERVNNPHVEINPPWIRIKVGKLP